MKRLHGIIPPVLTPFDKNGEIDFDRLTNYANFLRPHVQGFYVCGSYGSGVLMSVEERKEVFKRLSQFADENFQLVAHVGTTNLRDSLELAKHAEENNAIAVAAVPPFYFRHTEEALLNFFNELIQALTIPVYLYDNPGATGTVLSPELINRMSEKGLRGVKDSTFDIGKTYMVMRKVTNENFDVVIGSESQFLPAYMLGSRACISGLANVMPELMQKLYQAAHKGDFEKASALQKDVLKMWDILHFGPSLTTAYAMLKIRGFDIGYFRKPFMQVEKALYEKLENAMKENESVWNV